MADVVKKKKSRRLKRSVRRTLGALFLVSALVVAAIPTEGLQAAEVNGGVMPMVDTVYNSSLKWAEEKTKIPLVSVDEKNIYTDADGIFNFAWVRESSTSANRVAVILGYTGKTLDNNELVIDGTVDAYGKYQSNDSSNGGYVAVSQSREPLYYMSVERKVDKSHVVEDKDDDGKVISSTTVIDSYTIPSFSPCVKEDANWDRKGSMETYYYYRYSGTQQDYENAHPASSADALIKADTTNTSILTSSGAFLGSDGYVYIQTKEQEHQWIRQQTVAYIGNQYLVPYTDSGASSTNGSTVVQEYKVAEATANTKPENGIFAYQSNIQRLTVGKDLIGIGNYAFYNCALLSYVKFGNGLQEVGKSAFKLCTNMYGVGFDFGSNLSYISDEAFAYSGLQTFTLPVGVTQIYDHAFEGCTNLASIDLTGETQDPVFNEETQKWVQPVTTLNQLGCSVFKDCTSLTELKFPQTMTTPVHLDNFENCTLKHILVMDNQASFVPHDSTDTIKKFKEQMAEEFYFEAANNSRTHDFASDNGIAFKYSDQDLFELVVIEETPTGQIQSKVRYQIIPGANGEGNLSNFLIMQGEVKNVEIPEKIGPYGISALNEGSFSGNCSLEKITIPASVLRINNNAFKGCHNLKHVIFTAAENITTIGNNAFATQVVTSHSRGCDGSITNSPQLMFVGTVSY
ncbi:MAG: leucine-rich repeat domain-containing protein, partial [Acetatifactor sp.]|nr:leucine-rich repeat domain-containing protein [Acetatifactor sp.]